MRKGTILWFVLAGWWLALSYLLAGVLACLLIVTIQFGVASFKLALATVAPLGARIVPIEPVPPRYRAPAYR